MRTSMRSGVQAAVALMASLLLDGCGGGGGSGSSNPVPVDQPPVVTGWPAEAQASGASCSLCVESTDPEGGTLTYAWSSAVTGEAAPCIQTPDAASTTVLFPASGSYGIAVTVTDRAGNRTIRSTQVSVAGEDAFCIDALVMEDGVARSGVRGRLVWTITSQEILSAVSDAQGRIRFSGLKGTPADFSVRVLGDE